MDTVAALDNSSSNLLNSPSSPSSSSSSSNGVGVNGDADPNTSNSPTPTTSPAPRTTATSPMNLNFNMNFLTSPPPTSTSNPAITALNLIQNTRNPPSLASLPTEQRNPASTNIDSASTLELCRIMNDQDALVARAVKEVVPKIAEVIDAIVERVGGGGRLFYMGAGTSGRLGVLDAAELPPTFTADPMQFIALIAGGDRALRTSCHGVEDSREAGYADLDSLLPTPSDTLIGIAASGRTPYVLGALSLARRLDLLAVGLVCVRPSAMHKEGNCRYIIDPVTGPEVITGSTRLKAGSATKMVLNMISTGVHVRLGKTYGNLMVDVRASNGKLVSRARRIIRTVAVEFGLPPTYAGIFTDDALLDAVVRRCGGNVKLALVVVVSGWGVDLCREALARRDGVLKAVLEDVKYETVVRVFDTR